MADLKTINISLVSDVGNYDGNTFGLVRFFREQAITDLIAMCETQLVQTNEVFEEVGDYYGDEGDIDGVVEALPSEEVAGTPVEDIDIPQKLSDILDTTLSTKIGKFQAVISYYDDIIKLDGVVDDSIKASVIVQKFKELNGVFRTYGEFTVADTLQVI